MQKKVMAFPSKEEVKEIKNQFKPGVRVIMEHMCITPTPIPDGTKGTVYYVDDTGTVQCLFDNGKSYGLSLYSDCFHVESDGKDNASDSTEAERKQGESIPSVDDNQKSELNVIAAKMILSVTKLLDDMEALVRTINPAESEKLDKREKAQQSSQDIQRSAPQEER